MAVLPSGLDWTLLAKLLAALMLLSQGAPPKEPSAALSPFRARRAAVLRDQRETHLASVITVWRKQTNLPSTIEARPQPNEGTGGNFGSDTDHEIAPILAEGIDPNLEDAYLPADPTWVEVHPDPLPRNYRLFLGGFRRALLNPIERRNNFVEIVCPKSSYADYLQLSESLTHLTWEGKLKSAAALHSHHIVFLRTLSLEQKLLLIAVMAGYEEGFIRLLMQRTLHPHTIVALVYQLIFNEHFNIIQDNEDHLKIAETLLLAALGTKENPGVFSREQAIYGQFIFVGAILSARKQSPKASEFLSVDLHCASRGIQGVIRVDDDLRIALLRLALTWGYDATFLETVINQHRSPTTRAATYLGTVAELFQELVVRDGTRFLTDLINGLHFDVNTQLPTLQPYAVTHIETYAASSRMLTTQVGLKPLKPLRVLQKDIVWGEFPKKSTSMGQYIAADTLLFLALQELAQLTKGSLPPPGSEEARRCERLLHFIQYLITEKKASLKKDIKSKLILQGAPGITLPQEYIHQINNFFPKSK